MIKHIWSILARQSITDPDTNTITILESMENVRIDIQLKDNPLMNDYDRTQVNAFPMTFELVSLFYRSKKGELKTTEAEIEVIDPTGKILGKSNNPIIFQPEHNRFRARSKFDALGVTKSGVYLFRVFLKQTVTSKSELVSETPLDVTIYVDGEEVA